MTMLNLSNSNVQSMNSLQIAELVNARHDSVKRTIERLADQEAIEFPPTVEIPTATKPSRVYVFSGEQGKLDSITVVAQLCPLFTARMVKRWQELENQLTKVTPTDPIATAQSINQMADGIQILANATQAIMVRLDHTERYINLLELNQKGHVKITKKLAQTVKDYKAQGYPQASIARLLRISSASVSQIINDKYPFAELPDDPHVDRLIATAKSLAQTTTDDKE